jgi:hypothetical protein
MLCVALMGLAKSVWCAGVKQSACCVNRWVNSTEGGSHTGIRRLATVNTGVTWVWFFLQFCGSLIAFTNGCPEAQGKKKRRLRIILFEWLSISFKRLRKKYIQRIYKVFTPLDFFHVLLCYSLNLKWITFQFCVTGLHTIPHIVKVELCF